MSLLKLQHSAVFAPRRFLVPRHSAPQQPSWLRPRAVVAIVVATAGLATAIWLPTRNDKADAAERDRSGWNNRNGWTDGNGRNRSLTAFADDFTGAAGGPADPAKWGLRTDRVGGGMQFSQSNVRLDGNGNLVLVLRAENNGFSAARLFSKEPLRGTTGHLEARIQAPAGRSLRPAAELVSAARPSAGALNLLAAPVADGDFHTYAVDWKPGQVVLSVDGNQVDRRAPVGVDLGQPFRLALSLAVSNNTWERAALPARMVVD